MLERGMHHKLVDPAFAAAEALSPIDPTALATAFAIKGRADRHSAACSARGSASAAMLHHIPGYMHDLSASITLHGEMPELLVYKAVLDAAHDACHGQAGAAMLERGMHHKLVDPAFAAAEALSPIDPTALATAFAIKGRADRHSAGLSAGGLAAAAMLYYIPGYMLDLSAAITLHGEMPELLANKAVLDAAHDACYGQDGAQMLERGIHKKLVAPAFAAAEALSPIDPTALATAFVIKGRADRHSAGLSAGGLARRANLARVGRLHPQRDVRKP
jgi:hypothetical protein